MLLKCRAGLCLAHLGRLQEADEALGPLRSEGATVFPDLHLDVGVALAAMGQHARALSFLERLLVSDAWFS